MDRGVSNYIDKQKSPQKEISQKLRGYSAHNDPILTHGKVVEKILKNGLEG